MLLGLRTPLDPLHGDGYGHWLAGLIDGEGTFVIGHRSERNRCFCHFAVQLRDDDLGTLLTAQARTGLGRISHVGARGTSRPGAQWQIRSRADCMGLIEILDRFPLRAKKLRDYILWREAVLAWVKVRRVTQHNFGINEPYWRTMERCRSSLIEGRRYGAS